MLCSGASVLPRDMLHSRSRCRLLRNVSLLVPSLNGTSALLSWGLAGTAFEAVLLPCEASH